MFNKQTLSIFVRHLTKSPVSASINLLGLSIGLTVFILLTVWVKHELSFDNLQVNKNQIYRPSMRMSFGGHVTKISRSQAALLPRLIKDFPQIENGVRLTNASRTNPFVVRKEEKVFEERKFYYADSAFFKVFSFQLLKGSSRSVLVEPKSVVISESMAAKYFGTIDPIGKAIEVNNDGEYLITGLMKEAPSNSFFRPQFIASFSSLPVSRDPSWGPAWHETYLLLKKGADVEMLQAKTNRIIAEVFKNETSAAGDYVRYDFMPFNKLYLSSDALEHETTGNLTLVYLFGAIACIVLLVASINYINMSTALFADRAKEIAIKKVAGAMQAQLTFQLLIESALITLIAFSIALGSSALCLPWFNQITRKQFTSAYFLDFPFIVICTSLYLVLVILVGLYPALVLASFKPTHVLKGNFKTSTKGLWLRKSLLIFQFSASIVLIAGSLVIMKQLEFVQKRSIGYDKDHTIILPIDNKAQTMFSQLQTEFTKSGKIASVARSTENPLKINAAYSINIEGDNSKRQVLVNAMAVDTAFIPTLKIGITTGRNFTNSDIQRYQKDTTLLLIFNETAVKTLLPGKRDVLGAKIDFDGIRGELVGVVKDFNFSSLHKSIGPLVLFSDESQFNWMYLSFGSQDITSTINEVREIHKQLLPHRPFDYHFLDEQYDALYAREEQTARICKLFSILSISISSFGLMGLITLSVSQRTKEISLRKVLGASQKSIFLLISSEFGKLLFVSILIGSGLSYWLANEWLNSFAFKTSIGIIPHVFAASVCISILLLLVLYNVWRASQMNPTKALRIE